MEAGERARVTLRGKAEGRLRDIPEPVGAAEEARWADIVVVGEGEGAVGRLGGGAEGSVVRREGGWPNGYTAAGGLSQYFVGELFSPGQRFI